MSIAILEKYKVMLSVLAVIVFGGVILAGTFNTGDHGTAEAEPAEQEASKELAEKEPENSPWAAASFDDMLGEEAAEEEDGGFADSSPDGVFDDDTSSGFEPRSNEDTGPVFASAPAENNRTASNSRKQRIIVDASGGTGAPIPVNASLVSPEVGGKGRGDPTETD
ncbi:MAG: hypothetical protein AAGL10_15745 [Pseudomonadota bacterium]